MDWFVWVTTYKDVLTLMITAVGVPILLYQIFLGARQERERLRRRRIAATATLPLTLSLVSGYAQGMMRALAPLQSWSVNRQGGLPEYDGPYVPAEAIGAVEQMIEAAPSAKIARSLAAIVSDIQVLSSRTAGLRSGDASEARAQATMVSQNIVLAARIYARSEALFDFARTYSDEPEPPSARVRSALNLAGLRDHIHPKLHDLIDDDDEQPVSRRWFKRSWYAVGTFSARIQRKLWP